MAKIAQGKKVYAHATPPVIAEGRLFTAAELLVALSDRIPPLIWDEAGAAEIQALLAGVATTDFDGAKLQVALGGRREPEDWQVGEAMAEAYLTDHRNCHFPWPSSRDLRNPAASPAGADLVGFHAHKGSPRFAFGEVKTSTEKRWPPQVVTSRHGLAKQLEELRDSSEIKTHLGIRYMGGRANGSSWIPAYKSAASRYLGNPGDISLFGVLVRDVEHKEEDIKSRATQLAAECPKDTGIELIAMYLPAGEIPNLASHVMKGGKQ